jgi:Domain of Unknown Function (DUF1080)
MVTMKNFILTKKQYCLPLIIVAILFYASCVTTKNEADKKDWQTLFNGKDLKDWTVKMKVRYDQYDSFNNRYGHLYYNTPFSYYHLVVEYRFVGEWRKDAPSYTIKNSGVMFHSQDPRTMPKEQDWPISVELQLLAGLGDGKPRPTGNMCSPGTDVVFKGQIDPRHCIESTSKTYEGEQWVRAELIVLGDSLITHIINGDTVLQYSKPQIGGGVATGFDPKIKQDGKLLSTGFIAMQSEGQPIDFRKVEILNLEGCMNPKSKYYRRYFVKDNVAKCE